MHRATKSGAPVVRLSSFGPRSAQQLSLSWHSLPLFAALSSLLLSSPSEVGSHRQNVTPKDPSRHTPTWKIKDKEVTSCMSTHETGSLQRLLWKSRPFCTQTSNRWSKCCLAAAGNASGNPVGIFQGSGKSCVRCIVPRVEAENGNEGVRAANFVNKYLGRENGRFDTPQPPTCKVTFEVMRQLVRCHSVLAM